MLDSIFIEVAYPATLYFVGFKLQRKEWNTLDSLVYFCYLSLKRDTSKGLVV